ncbi:CCA tRNA nucleotidyltransferase, mitochondrial [Neonectria magnoliae]|uniref:CCA tRNA nucleotidyltransferase, mitochondrial n=1 Tax=Neonectria magnoliae TaxID=2732573 RepID=A0ABR1H2A0_9HYPO
MATASVQLNPREQQLRRLLLDVASSIDEAGNAGEPIVLRWAGGWVRDKLLDIESNDIDVAINAMTGVPFAQHMCDYCEKPNAIVKHGIGPDDIGSLHNVARNPDKSKHLETAMVKMFGLDLDFVNLRKETYTEDSRNPQMEFGTAQEDALRRDATVNALFYNLHTDQVEDLTGGLQDMAAKRIRTPLEPFQTFMDDPLRVLRLVRFASRLQFTIDASTRQFMADPSVLEALRVKISRERVGVELEKMLKGAHPCESLRLIDELGLYSAVFADPSRTSMGTPDTSKWPIAYKCLDELIQDRMPGSIGHLLINNEDGAYYAWNLAAVCPWMDVHDQPNPKRKANAPPPVAVAAREGFKAPNKLTDIITASYRNRSEILSLKKAVCNREAFISERDRFGMAIRRWDAQVGSWRLQVLNAILVESMEILQQWSATDLKEKKEFLAEWQAFLDHLIKLDVCEAPSLKRLLDGRQLAKALGVKPGIWTGKALEICVAWQLRNPEATDPVGAIDEVRQNREELGIPLQ